MDSKADGKGKEGFLQRSVGSEALILVLRAGCSSHVPQYINKRREAAKPRSLSLRAVSRAGCLNWEFEWKRRNVRYSLCDF